MDIHEEWRKSPLAPNHIEVSNFGRARSIDRLAPINHGARKGLTQLRKGTMLSPYIGHHGYLIISVKEGDKRPKHLLHRLIAAAFCDDFCPSLSVNHIDGNKLNNHAENLEWVTLNRNTQHQWEIGLVNLRGQSNPHARLSDVAVLAIREAMSNKESATKISREYGISVSLVYKIHYRQRWTHI